jgi:hypothetical protein
MFMTIRSKDYDPRLLSYATEIAKSLTPSVSKEKKDKAPAE